MNKLNAYFITRGLYEGITINAKNLRGAKNIASRACSGVYSVWSKNGENLLSTNVNGKWEDYN